MSLIADRISTDSSCVPKVGPIRHGCRARINIATKVEFRALATRYDSSYHPIMVVNRIDQLSRRECDCLRLVARNFSSKEIGRELGLSHHTVDDHLKRAISLLGVTSRFEAARLLSEREGSPQVLGAQPPQLVEALPVGPAMSPDRSDVGSSWTLPIRRGRRINDLNSAQRLLWIALGAFAFIVALAQLATGLNAVMNVKTGIGF